MKIHSLDVAARTVLGVLFVAVALLSCEQIINSSNGGDSDGGDTNDDSGSGAGTPVEGPAVTLSVENWPQDGAYAWAGGFSDVAWENGGSGDALEFSIDNGSGSFDAEVAVSAGMLEFTLVPVGSWDRTWNGPGNNALTAGNAPDGATGIPGNNFIVPIPEGDATHAIELDGSSNPAEIRINGELYAEDFNPGGGDFTGDAYADYAPTSTMTTDYFGEVRAAAPGDESLAGDHGWYANESFYHIWVNAFRDSDGDGIGDIPGIIDRLDYIDELGATAIWLSPIFRTAGETPDPDANMHGYDVTNHYEINPYFGTKDDVADLLDAAHGRGIRVIFDFVPNHLSTAHPWFFAASNPEHPEHDRYRDYFVWSDTDHDADYNGPWGQDVWHRNRSVGEGHPLSYYYGVFVAGMPDLNYENPDVRREMSDVITYWLNFGFDGMRVDAVKYLYEEDTDGNPQTAPIMSDAEENQAYFAAVREELLDPYTDAGHAKFMVVENWTNTASLDTYAAWDDPNGGETALAEMSFDFEIGQEIAAHVIGSGTGAVADYLDRRAGYKMPESFRYGNFLSNHDNVRSRPMTHFGNETDSALAAAYAILSPGVPFVYYGNEIGMEGQSGQDLNLRQPFIWDELSVQDGNVQSLLEWYRALLTVRNSYPAVADGAWTQLTDSATGDALSAFARHSTGETTIVVVSNVGSSSESDVTIDVSSVEHPSAGVLSVLIGPSDGGGATFSSGELTVPDMPGDTLRVYAVGSDAEDHVIADRDASGAVSSSSVSQPGEWDWGASAAGNRMVTVDAAAQQYVKERTLSAGDILFKFWAEDTWYGYGELTFQSGPSAAGVQVEGVEDGFGGTNIQATLPSAGTFQFHFDLDDLEFWITAE